MGLALSALLPLAGPLASMLVKGAEKLFGSKSGETKFNAVAQALMPFVDALVASGKLPAEFDKTSAIGPLVEMVVQQLKSTGDLDAAPTTWMLQAAGTQVSLPPGTKITIEVPAK